ncbi:putative non-specific serine/threonine protein kinase [Helianthus anomalus]
MVSFDLSFNEINIEPHVFINLLQNLTVMKELSLTFVNISAVLPSNLNISSSSLNLLNLGSTGLHGNPPPNFFSLQSLENLDLSENSLTGHIPSEISLPKLDELVSLSMKNLLIQPCFFNISLFKNSTFLRYLTLWGVNSGSTSLPTYINISSSLRSLDLIETRLQGKLPDNIFTHLLCTTYTFCRKSWQYL